MSRTTIMMATLIFLGGCAIVNPNMVLPVALDKAAIDQGTLASLTSSNFEIGAFDLVGKQSRRAATDNVTGYYNYGDVHDLKTTDPVPALVSGAISLGLVENGHRISEGAPIRIEGDITLFWVFTKHCRTGSSIKVTVRAIEEKTGDLIFENDYGGVHESITDCSSNAEFLKHSLDGFKFNHKQRTEALNEGLRRLVRQFTHDQNLVDALQARSQ